MKLKKVILLSFICSLAFVLIGCAKTDVVAKVAVTSFEDLTSSIPKQVQYDSTVEGWAVSGLDGKDRIILSKDFQNDSDILLELEAEEFINAGLDVTKLPADQYSYDEASDKIKIRFDFGDEKFNNTTKASAVNTLNQIIKYNRENIGYHEAGDHYMITMGDGNMFAWAKDMKSNKTDLAFILNPEPFIKAGLDTSKLKNWIYTKLPMMNKEGKTVKEDKLVKGFNIN